MGSATELGGLARWSADHVRRRSTADRRTVPSARRGAVDVVAHGESVPAHRPGSVAQFRLAAQLSAGNFFYIIDNFFGHGFDFSIGQGTVSRFQADGDGERFFPLTQAFAFIEVK